MENTISLYEKGTGYNRRGWILWSSIPPVVVMEIYMELEIMIWIFVVCGDYGDIVDIGLWFWLKKFYEDFSIENNGDFYLIFIWWILK